ncbi:MAG: flagellar FliL protein [Crocinitomicaceae bacterium]|jgi:flagellar FliL protein
MAKEKELQLDAVEEPPKSKRKLIIIIVAVLILVGGGVGAAILLLGGDNSIEEVSAESETVEGETVEGELVEEEPVSKAPAIYIKLKPEFIVNYQVGPRQRYLQVYMEAMTRDPSIADALEIHSPMIRSSIISLLSQQPFEYLRSAEGRASVRQLVTEEVQRLVEQETGITTGVEQILFTNYVMQ